MARTAASIAGLLLLCSAASAQEKARAGPVEVDVAIAEISPLRVRADVDKLVSFGTRHSLSATEGPRGIGAARNWIKSRLEAIAAGSGRTGDAAMQVRFDVHHAPPAERIPVATDIVNVEAVLPGAMPEAAGRRYYLVAHYDSRASAPLDAASEAPGANDDGSGTAALLEAALVLSRQRFDATIVFLAVAGEEQGLVGSRMHAKAARDSKSDVRAVLSNDIVGDPSRPDGPPLREVVRVFSEGVPHVARPEEVKRIIDHGGENDSASRQLARYVAEVAALHRTRIQPKLVFRTDRFLRSGDHLAFLEQGIAAVRFTEPVEKFDRQHQDVRTVDGKEYADLARFVDPAYVADVAALDAACLAHLASAPSSPGSARIVAKDLGNETLLRWSRVPEKDATGYEVVWRATTSATWEQARDVGDVTEATLPVSKDDWLFGVRAYDKAGYRSPVSFAVPAKD